MQVRFQDLLPEIRLLKALLLGIGTAFGLAVAYVYGGGMKLLGNPEFVTIDGYAFTIAILVGSLVPVMYYLYFRDVSEAVAVFAGLAWSLWFGLEDIFVYLVSVEHSVPKKLPWLSDSIVGMVSSILGFNEVTGLALYTVVLLTGVLLFLFVKILEGLEKRFLGVKI